jgi:hypothetical protein
MEAKRRHTGKKEQICCGDRDSKKLPGEISEDFAGQ